MTAALASTVELHLGSGEVLAFSQPVVSVGRDPSCDVVIDHPMVSPRHVEIRVGEYGTTIADCEGSSGTYHQGEQIDVMMIAPGPVYPLALGDPFEITLGVFTSVPMRGPAGHTSRTWSIDRFAFQSAAARGMEELRARSARRSDAATAQLVLAATPEATAAAEATATGDAAASAAAEADGGSPVIHADLFVVGMPAEHRSFSLRQAKVRIGRSRSCDIVIPEACEGVSGQHAELRWDGQLLWIVDLQSTNGTYVEGQRVASTPIPAKGRSTIRLGHSRTGLMVSYERPHDGPRPPGAPPELPVRRTGAVPEGDRTAGNPTDVGILSAEGTIARALRCAARWYPAAPVERSAPVELGIIGTVGAGKSSLLNALLAPGCQLLPGGGAPAALPLPVRVVAAAEPVLRVSYRGRAWLEDAARAAGPPPGPGPDAPARLALLCTGDPQASRDPGWLAAALRHVLDPGVERSPDADPETRDALERLSALLAAGAEPRTWSAGQNAADFFLALRDHVAGQLAPFCASIEIGWPSPLLASGVTVVDLPGMRKIGTGQDAAAPATVAWLREARAVLVVCNGGGLTEIVAEALRQSGFIGRWAAGAAQLMVGITKLDLEADDERRIWSMESWSPAFEAVAKRTTELVRTQLARSFPDAADRVATAPICPVTARELQRFAHGEPDDPPLLAAPVETGFPALWSEVLSLPA